MSGALSLVGPEWTFPTFQGELKVVLEWPFGRKSAEENVPRKIHFSYLTWHLSIEAALGGLLPT